jgi:hypothetical protein
MEKENQINKYRKHVDITPSEHNVERDALIANIIWERNFDIPDWMYEEITPRCLTFLFESIQMAVGHDKDIYDSFMQAGEDFFPKIKERFYSIGCAELSKDEFFDSLYYFHSPYGVLVAFEVLSDYQIAYWCKHYVLKYYKHVKPDKWSGVFEMEHDYAINLLITVASVKPPDMIRLVATKIYGGIRSAIRVIMYQLRRSNLVFRTETSIMVKILYALGVHKYYKLTIECNKLGYPVLYQYADLVDANLYIETIKRMKYTGEWDANLLKNRDIYYEYGDVLIELAINLNQNNLKYLVPYLDRGVSWIINLYSPELKHPIHCKDFSVLVDICNDLHRGSWMPMNIQKLFLINGGDVKTMVSNDHATILKTFDELDFLLEILSVEDIRYLIYNSTEFVTCIINHVGLIRVYWDKILKAIFVLPVDEGLYRTIHSGFYDTVGNGTPIVKPNKEGKVIPMKFVEDTSHGYRHKKLVTVDYRMVILNAFIVNFTLDRVLRTVPEVMTYLDTSLLFIYNNRQYIDVSYIPAHKMLSQLPSILSSEQYHKLNLFCNGEYHTLEDYVSVDTLVSTIGNHHKYWYLADLKKETADKIIDILCEE